MALLTSRSALHAVGIELDRRYENAGCLCRLSVHHQAGSREMGYASEGSTHNPLDREPR